MVGDKRDIFVCNMIWINFDQQFVCVCVCVCVGGVFLTGYSIFSPKRLYLHSVHMFYRFIWHVFGNAFTRISYISNTHFTLVSLCSLWLLFCCQNKCFLTMKFKFLFWCWDCSLFREIVGFGFSICCFSHTKVLCLVCLQQFYAHLLTWVNMACVNSITYLLSHIM